MINDPQSRYMYVEVASHCISSFSLRLWIDVYIILEVVAPPCHFASLSQFYVYYSTDLASNCVVEIFALLGIHQQVFCPLYSGRLRISYFVDERCKLSFMLALQALYRRQIW